MHASDPIGDLDAFRALADAEAAPLLEAAAACDPASPAAVARLRRSWPAELVTAALSLVRARAMLEGRIDNARALFADPAGAEQASSSRAARWKALRFQSLGRPIVDLCCGIGGDLLELRRAAPARGVDHHPVRAWMAARNTGCPVDVADVCTLPLSPDEAYHLDPARRSDQGRRGSKWAQLRPGPEMLNRLLTCDLSGAIKLGPGLDYGDLPADARCEIEMIGEEKRLVQAVLWCGRFMSPESRPQSGASGAARLFRRATRLPDERTMSGWAMPPPATPSGNVHACLHVPDPAVERAGLVGTLVRGTPLGELHPGIGLLTGAYRASLPEDIRTWMTSFHIVDRIPYRLAAIESRLSSLGARVVEVRTRGGAIDADAAQRSLGRGGGHPDTVIFGLRLGRRRVALITRPDTDDS